MIGEADWAIINLNNDKFYTGTNELYNNQNLNNKLYNLFQTTHVSSWTESLSSWVESKDIKIARILAKKLEETFWIENSLERLKKISKSTKNTKVKNIISETMEILNS